MTSTAPRSQDANSDTMPLAHIDAQDISSVSAVREFLEQNGCRVMINDPPNNPVMYSIVAGDYRFVKRILANKNTPHSNTLVIVFDSDVSKDAFRDFPGIKVVVVDDEHLTQKSVLEIFSFYFTDSSIFVDKRRKVHEPHVAVASHASAQHAHASVNTPPPYRKEFHGTDEQRIQAIMKDVFGDMPHMHPKQKNHNNTKRRRGKTILPYICIVLLMILFPYVWYATSITATIVTTITQVGALRRGDTSASQRYANVGTYWLRQSGLALTLIRPPFIVLQKEEAIRGQERIVSLLSDIQQVVAETTLMGELGHQIISEMMGPVGKQTLFPASAFEHLRLSSDAARSTLGLISSQANTLINDKTFPFNIPSVSVYATNQLRSLATVRNLLETGSKLLTLYPKVAGFRGQKTFLVLLQNNNELRPTGGFIGSLAVIRLEEGVIADIGIQDVYVADGQLKGHVAPPIPIKELLGQEHWYLRDSNWDPDFFVSGEKAAWFYEKETGTAVDGVVAVNMSVVTDLLKAIGPVFVPDINDRISADNLFGKSIYYTQANFFPGSTQKSDFLGALSRTIITTVAENTSANPVAVFRAVVKGLGGRDIMLYAKDPETQKLIEYDGWGGRVSTGMFCATVGEHPCLSDPLIASEANVSVSKVNYFIKHSTSRNISLGENGIITETISRTVSNTAIKAETGVSGPYRAYLRFYVPADASISDVAIDGVKVLSRNLRVSAVPAPPYVEPVESKTDLQGIGITLDVDIGEAKSVSVTYTRTRQLLFGRGESFLDISYPKHPGIEDEQMSMTLRYPATFRVTPADTTNQLVAKDGQLQYNTVITNDQSIHIRITK